LWGRRVLPQRGVGARPECALSRSPRPSGPCPRNGVLAPDPNARRLAVTGATYQLGGLVSFFVGHNQSVTAEVERDLCPAGGAVGCGIS